MEVEDPHYFQELVPDIFKRNKNKLYAQEQELLLPGSNSQGVKSSIN